jgi:phosphomannomutase
LLLNVENSNMSLIKSISGLRGTIGGSIGNNLTPIDAVKFAAAYGTWLLRQNVTGKKIIIGRDARLSGNMIQQLVANTLVGMGFDIIDLGLSTTPTVELAVPAENAIGGIILTASHNPVQWNALKLLNSKGEFISAADGAALLQTVEKESYAPFVEVHALGSIQQDNTWLQKHIDLVLAYPLVNKSIIANKKLKVVLDPINSSGALVIPQLLKALGIAEIIMVHGEVHGNFAHNPEPLKEHLQDLSKAVVEHKADLGIAVDPDVDRLCFVNEDGELFGEEYTLVAVADYILSKRKGTTVSNLSSTKSLKELTENKYSCNYIAAAVGEVNVVTAMKEHNAVIGGEGNGGIIVPDFHYGRDALIGIALFLTHLAEQQKMMSALRATYPNYYITKDKKDLPEGTDVKAILEKIKADNADIPSNTVDGLKLHVGNDWVHLRASNTEPIIRIYAEADDKVTADELAERFKAQMQ